VEVQWGISISRGDIVTASRRGHRGSSSVPLWIDEMVKRTGLDLAGQLPASHPTEPSESNSVSIAITRSPKLSRAASSRASSGGSALTSGWRWRWRKPKKWRSCPLPCQCPPPADCFHVMTRTLVGVGAKACWLSWRSKGKRIPIYLYKQASVNPALSLNRALTYYPLPLPLQTLTCNPPFERLSFEPHLSTDSSLVQSPPPCHPHLPSPRKPNSVFNRTRCCASPSLPLPPSTPRYSSLRLPFTDMCRFVPPRAPATLKEPE
jgi:hypothetical protein